MNTKQHKHAFIRQEAVTCLRLAEACIRSGARQTASHWLDRGLAFARQLPETGTNRAFRAQHIIAIEAMKDDARLRAVASALEVI